MDPKAAELIAERFQWTLAICEFGERMLRQRLRKKNPDATDAEIDAAIIRWRWDRPGAPQGDAEGIPGSWPRQR